MIDPQETELKLEDIKEMMYAGAKETGMSKKRKEEGSRNEGKKIGLTMSVKIKETKYGKCSRI